MLRSLSVACLAGLLVAGCAPIGDDVPLPSRAEASVDDAEFVGEGVVYADLSERFLVTVYQTRIVEDRGGDYLVYSLAISNESDQPYEDLVVTVIPTSQIDQYLAAGAIPVPMSPVDIAAKGAVPGPTEGVGVDVFAERLLSDDKFMKDAGLRREDLWELAEEYEITVTWKGGGEENYQLSSPVVDETSH